MKTKKYLSTLLWFPPIICWITAYLLSGKPEDTKEIQYYSEFLKDSKPYNYRVQFDKRNYTHYHMKKGHNFVGSYEYITKNDTSILVFDDVGGDNLDSSPALLSRYGYEHDPRITENDSLGTFLKDSNGYFLFRLISGNSYLVHKNENLVYALVILPILVYSIGIIIYSLILWLWEKAD